MSDELCSAKHGISLDHALRFFTDRNFWWDYSRHWLVPPGERRAARWQLPDCSREVAKQRLEADLLSRLRSGELLATGLRAGDGARVAIPTTTWFSPSCVDFAGRVVAGAHGSLSEVRVRTAAGLHLRVAMRVFGPQAQVAALESLEARGFETLFAPYPHDDPDDHKVWALKEQLWKALTAHLTTGHLQADGRDPRASYSAGRTPIAASDWPALVEAGLHGGEIELNVDIKLCGIELHDVRVRWPANDRAAPAAEERNLSFDSASRRWSERIGNKSSPGLTPSEAYQQVVAYIRSLAEASPTRPTVTSRVLWKQVQQDPRWGPLVTEDAYRQARQEALARYPAWTRKGLPSAAP